jgi:hypothetical protein
MESLPTTSIGLVGFIVIAFIGSQGWIIRYFMTYIQKKNANLERVSENFAKTMKDITETHRVDRDEWMEKLEQCHAKKS